MINVFLWVAVHAMQELSMALMLYNPDTVVVSTMIWSMWQNGRTADAAVLGRGADLSVGVCCCSALGQLFVSISRGAARAFLARYFAMISVRDLEKTFAGAKGEVRALRGVSFEVGKGELFTLLGPSGCGKTTTLRCIAGLEQPLSGEIVINDRIVFQRRQMAPLLPPEQRQIGMVFQSYAIWPHMTVFQNVAYPLASDN